MKDSIKDGKKGWVVVKWMNYLIFKYLNSKFIRKSNLIELLMLLLNFQAKRVITIYLMKSINKSTKI